ncbi:MAG: reverse transcriptase N-terminal domain-containing protein [Microcystis aeruginosa PMC 728.11]|nr:reverse transcriptase N-terminal domain-containing protein [Microcystis aeruginosa PMC 728.11]
MTTVQQMDKWKTWQDINWKKVERQVFKLQKRIFRASSCGDVKKVHRLQKLLLALPNLSCKIKEKTDNYC